jgi:carbamoyl-phosphate synthase large subunit
MEQYNILVTGCGGDIGQSIGKILTSNEICRSLVGSDIHLNHPGKFIFDSVDILPKCSDKNYKNELRRLITKYKINLVIPSSEQELRLFTSDSSFEEEFPILAANRLSRDVGFDKYKTIEFLKTHELPYPQTQLENQVDLDKLKYPFIMKGRTGAGGSEIALINNHIDFEYYQNKIKNFILQEYLVGDEYTCGIYRKNNSANKSIVLRRQLSSNNGGYTLFGEVVQNVEIDRLLINIAEKLNIKGSVNIQLRLTADNIPYVFEINPRFSSTVLFRHLIGFEDLVWSIKEYFNIDAKIDNDIKIGVKFYKGYNEYIDN